MSKLKRSFDIFKYSDFIIPILGFLIGVKMIFIFNFFDKLAYENRLKEEIKNNVPRYIEEQTNKLVDFTQHSKDVISSIAHSKSMKDYIANGNIEQLKNLMKTIASAEKSLMQLRFVDQKGVEKIRFDRYEVDYGMIEVPDDKLQDKSSRNYIAQNIGKHQRVWFSDLDLNMEFGKIEIPFRPTFRVVLPIWHNGKFSGMIVMNYFANLMLSKIFPNSSDYHASIIDEDGYTIYSTNNKENWSRFQTPPFKVKNDNYLFTKKINTPFANALFMQASINDITVDKKYNKERDHIKEVSFYMLFVLLLTTTLLYYVIRQSKLKLENIKVKLDLKDKLLQEERKTNTLSHIVDKHVITSTTDTKGTILSASKAFCTISGYDEDELIGKQHNIVRHPDMPKSFYKKLWKTIKQNHTWYGRIKNITKNGTVYWVDATIEPLYDTEGNKVGYSAIRQDVTYEMLIIEKEEELSNLNANLEARVKNQVKQITNQQNILIQQNKMAAMGEMIANIAHQWKQPLSMLSLAILAMKKKYDKNKLDDIYMKEFVGKSEKFIHKMDSTISDFSNYFSPNKDKSDFDLYRSILNVQEFFESILKKEEITFTIKRHNKNEPAILNGFKNELEQVILNLIKNSIDSITDNEIKNAFIEIIVVDNSNEWDITFKDNGGGTEEEIVDRIFEPYFTTKFKSDGTGIGLYMSKMIIEQTFSGSIMAENDPDGLMFKITLPKNMD